MHWPKFILAAYIIWTIFKIKFLHIYIMDFNSEKITGQEKRSILLYFNFYAWVNQKKTSILLSSFHKFAIIFWEKELFVLLCK